MKNHSIIFTTFSRFQVRSAHFFSKKKHCIRNKHYTCKLFQAWSHSRFITGYDTIFYSLDKSKKQFLESQLSIRNNYEKINLSWLTESWKKISLGDICMYRDKANIINQNLYLYQESHSERREKDSERIFRAKVTNVH